MDSLSNAAIQVRAAQVSDAETIIAGNIAMAWETEQLRLDRQKVDPGVRAALSDASKGFYLVAEVDGQVAGQMMITFEWSDWRNTNIWWIQSVYVIPEFRRKGVFTALYRHAENLARSQHVAAIRLYVEKKNAVAQKTYESLGMKLSHYAMMEKAI